MFVDDSIISFKRQKRKFFDGLGWIAPHTTNSTSTLLGLSVPACVSRKNEEAPAVVTTNHCHHNSLTVGSCSAASDAFYGHPIKVSRVPHGHPGSVLSVSISFTVKTAELVGFGLPDNLHCPPTQPVLLLLLYSPWPNVPRRDASVAVCVWARDGQIRLTTCR